MHDSNDILTDGEVAGERAQRALDALTDGNYRTAERPARRTGSEVRVLLDRLQMLADNPQLRHRLGYARVSVEMPFSDSRRPTDPRDGSRLWVMDYGFSARDADRNYAAGLL
jgi:hypothetical protein